ncbi:ATP synthase subunit C [Candidatus Gugararchaeum adminiculabundum]|nr:ATP synthase subunit C [Candidatus Gugararchaeum adminiculabundum]
MADVGTGLIALSSAFAMIGGAMGTAWAQVGIGSAAMGVLAEKPEAGGQLLLFIVLPETIVILGFVISFFLLGKVA